LFVGMTRAKEQLQLSMGQYREFRGQRRMTIPSPFLLELPRHELRLSGFGPQTAGQYNVRAIADDLVHEAEGIEPEHLGDDALDFDVHAMPAEAESPASPTAAHGPAVALATAAELHEGAAPAAPPVSPDDFAHGMIVRHPQYGLGKIVALSGAGPRRVATVAFASSAGQKKFVLSQSQIRPVRSP
jgi:DNA helicase-2/ATP-dependent DNA helicase PcrA